jgi:DNA-binding FadR family transcriptional regulator
MVVTMVGRPVMVPLHALPEYRPEDAALRERLGALLRDPSGAGSERGLAARLGVTRHRLRLVLARMRETGELDPPPRPKPLRRHEGMIRGTNPVEVIELRMALEPALARLAAVRATPFDIARIERAATTPAGEDQGRVDLTFHTLVAASSGNALARDIYALLRRVGSDLRIVVSPPRAPCPNRLRQRDAEHRAVAAAIAARDADAAEAAMRTHLAAVRQRILDRLAPGAVASGAGAA